MNSKMRHLSAILAAGAMALLIMDTKTAYSGAKEGLSLCMEVIIPSLFPFFVFSNHLCSTLVGQSISGTRILRERLHIPAGSESLLVVGLLGGYPVGAQLIAQAYKNNQIDRKTACILLGYCSNAGPAFIFGVAGSLFSSKCITLSLWMIHIFSALITGFLLPRPPFAVSKNVQKQTTSIVQSVRSSIFACASVCTWVILFRVLIAYINRLFIGSETAIWLTVLKGLLELSNGCLQLSHIDNDAARYILCSFILAFGGLCVLLQTTSVTENLGLGFYLPGKILQSCVSVLLSLILIPVLFTGADIPLIHFLLLSSVCLILIILIKASFKKRGGNPANNHV